MIARLLIAAGVTAMVSQTVATRPWQALFAVGLLAAIAGALMLVDEWDEVGVRERLEQDDDREAAEQQRRDRLDDYAPAGEMPGGWLPQR